MQQVLNETLPRTAWLNVEIDSIEYVTDRILKSFNGSQSFPSKLSYFLADKNLEINAIAFEWHQ